MLSLPQVSLDRELLGINLHELFSYAAKCQVAKTLLNLTSAYVQHLKAAAQGSVMIHRSHNKQKPSRTIED